MFLFTFFSATQSHCFIKFWLLTNLKHNKDWLLYQSLMIGWRKNYWKPERVSSVLTSVSVCLPVCLSVSVSPRATEHIFWPRSLIFGLSNPWHLRKKTPHFYACYLHISMFSLYNTIIFFVWSYCQFVTYKCDIWVENGKLYNENYHDNFWMGFSGLEGRDLRQFVMKLFKHWGNALVSSIINNISPSKVKI